MKTPTPEEVRKKREIAGLTQAAAAELVHYVYVTAWARVEQGARRMPIDKWELFLIKTGQHPEFKARSST